MGSVLVSSDHHANWEALEKLFMYAHKEGLPFLINGDIVGDYNFEIIAQHLGFKFPYEIEEEIFSEEFSLKEYQMYQFAKRNNGSIEPLLGQVPAGERKRVKEYIESVLISFSRPEAQRRMEELRKKAEPLVRESKFKLRSLYTVIIKEHAQRLATLIDRYKVPVYFVLGNHEPVYFCDFVWHYLNDESLFVDLGSFDGVLNLHGLDIVGVSNVNAVMPFLSDIYSDSEVAHLFSHQLEERELLHGNVTKKTIKEMKVLSEDSDWLRVSKGNRDVTIDVFLSHGQIGQGAWRDTKKANEVPTLAVAAKFSDISHITVDGHLHTSHEMKNPLGTPTIRGVGNVGYVISKDEAGVITYEKISVDAPYDARGGFSLSDVDFERRVKQEFDAHFS